MLAWSDVADATIFVVFWTIVHSLWQATILAAALAVWRRFVPERAVEPRAKAAALTMVFLLAAPLATATWLGLTYERRAASAVDSIEFALLEEFVEDEESAPIDLVATTPGASPAETSTLTFSSLRESMPRYVTALWTLGAIYLATRRGVAAARLHVERRKSLPAGEALVAKCRVLAARCGLSRVPDLRLSTRASGPFACGLWRPMIVLPASWALETSPEALEAAIAHEISHFKRGDLWILAVQRCAETALFYHPGVWYVGRVLDVERERRADRSAAELLGDPAAYAESLCRLASLVAAPASPAWNLPFLGESRMNLLDRVRCVLRTDEARARGLGGVGWLCLPPAILAAAFLGQSTVSGSLRADDDDRPREERQEETDHDDREEEEVEGAEYGEEDDEERMEKEEEDEDPRDESGDEEADDDAREGDGPIADLRRMFAAERQRQEEAVSREREAAERRLNEQVAAAQASFAESMAKLNATRERMAAELEQKFARIAAARLAEMKSQGSERPDRKDGGREAEPTDREPTDRERRLMRVVAELESRVREMQARLEEGARREGEQAQEGEKRREADRPREEDRPHENSEGEREDQSAEDGGEDRERGALAERLYRALRSDEISGERKSDFVRRVVNDVFGMELNEEQAAFLIERSRGEFEGFRQTLTRIANAAKSEAPAR